MRNRVTPAALALCLILALLPVNAQAAVVASGTCGTNLKWTLDSDVLTISGSGAMEDFSKGRAPWQSNLTNIGEVRISSGATSIGAYAFSGCIYVKKVTIASSVTSIGNYAFQNCSGRLSSVTIPDNVTSIGAYAFSNCTNLSSLNIPNKVTTIGSYAFDRCGKLTGDITIPASVTSIGVGAFSGTGFSNIQADSSNSKFTSKDGVLFTKDQKTLLVFPGGRTSSYQIPSGVTRIENFAFEQCGLTGVDIPSSVSAIGISAFSGCTSMTSAKMVYGVKTIEDRAFYGCTSLTSVTVPSGASIGGYAFSGCSALKSADICSGVTRIMDNAFQDCRSLASVNIPERMDRIFPSAFTGCDSLQDVYYAGSKKQWEKVQISHSNDPLKNATIHYAKFDIVATADPPEGGTVTGGGTYLSTYPCTLTATAKDGYTFEAWTRADGTQVSTDATYKIASVTQDLEFVAKFTGSAPVAYTVIFDSQGGGAVPSQTVPENGTVTRPLNPSLTGHTFGGWYREAECTNVWDFDNDTVTGDLTLYAKWTANLYYVRYVWKAEDGGIHIFLEQPVSYNGKLTVPDPAPQRIGYLFGGWYRELDCKNAWNFDTDTVKGDIPLYAKWTPITYSITFDSQGGAPVDGQTVGSGGKVSRPDDPTPADIHHTFGGWYREAECTNVWDFDNDTVTGDLTLYAKWTPREYTIQYGWIEGGAFHLFAKQFVSYNNITGIPDPAPQRPGYLLEGWYTDQTYTKTWDFDKDTVTGDITLYAKWTADPSVPQGHTVTFNSQGGSAVPSQTVGRGGKVSRPDDPTPADIHHTFGGWYREAECTNVWDFDNDTVTGDLTLYAKWTPISQAWTITLDPQGGTLPPGQSPTVTTTQDGKLAALPREPIRDGYTFGGWFTYKTGGTEIDTSTVFTADTTVYAHWSKNGGDTPGPDVPKAFTVTFDPNGGTGGGSRTTGPDGRLAALPAAPVRDGYTFGGWFTHKTGGTEIDTSTVFTADTTVYARWSKSGGDTPGPDVPKAFTVTFDPSGGTGGGSRTTGPDGRLSALPAAPVRDGYTFGGWFTHKTGGTEIGTSTVFTADTTVYAHWSRNSPPAGARYRIYTPSRTPGGSFSVSHSSAAEGTRITIELSPRRGYELDWLSVTNLNTGRELRLTRRYSDEYTFTMPDSDVDVEITFAGEYTGTANDTPETPQPAAKPFRWYYSNGFIYHVTDGLVPAGTALTRDMLVSVLYSMDDTSSGEPEFWATNNAIIPDIYESGLLGTDKVISREQAAMILFGYARHKSYNISQRASLSGYADYGQIRPIAQPAMAWARAAGLIAGTSASTLSPKGTLTCGQANTILSRFLANVAWSR